jgi:aldehyde dehydrogenase (NAD+)
LPALRFDAPPASQDAALALAQMDLPAPSGAPKASPIDGSALPTPEPMSGGQTDHAIAAAHRAFLLWRSVPAPVRGELVRQFGALLRHNRDPLGRIVSIETGKPLSEGIGEVQEMIDICDFAVGLSRQLYGLTIASERRDHHMRETWHPLGPVGVISAFNFPVAVWAWNAALALVCGNSVLWKPSPKTTLSAYAAHALFSRAAAAIDEAPPGLSQVLFGDAEIGQALCDHRDVALVSATGSVAMGRAVGVRVAQRFGRSLLELGGNAAAIVTPSADLDLSVRAIAFSAAGTTGQRCTTLRRLIVHNSIRTPLLARLKKAFSSLPIGDPRQPGILVGPLIDEDALSAMQAALGQARADGGTVFGGEHLETAHGCYVRPAIVEMPTQTDIVRHETFAPILYVMGYETFDQAIALQRDVPQGLSSAILSNDLRETERFLSATGSDCGIANVNMGTSGAEIGGAFGGEKETGGGRESGSDSWKAYMRRQTQNINFGTSLPLAQGVRFDLD